MLGSMHAVQVNHLRHHRYCLGEEDVEAMSARTIRNPLKARLTYAMFYHVEHHLYPAVATRRLPILARRLDRVAPDLGALKVF
jgi:fatty acid desaturase